MTSWKMDHHEWVDVSPIEKLGDFPGIAVLVGPCWGACVWNFVGLKNLPLGDVAPRMDPQRPRGPQRSR